ncbi:cupin domain-containing protein [Lactiplantibacillus plajomi]|uniref:Cupin domain-containing protein n=1 Tax=Lactiplantibacillus plajomi TaxID=1457217 RepID=A0ABV6K5E8_9LACO|nr:cupin domain-containing protein [Lactiplantibacillus plajomi]
MKILHETVQPLARLPFKFYEHDPETPINVAPHWHQGIELNYLVRGETLTFVVNGTTTIYHPGDLWTVNRRRVHSASGRQGADWQEFGLIIDDHFLRDRVPSSQYWQLTLGQDAQATQAGAYATVRDHLLAIRTLVHQPAGELQRPKFSAIFTTYS